MLKTLLNSLLLTSALIGATTQAASNGALGASSTGTIGISLEVKEAVRISALKDIALIAEQGQAASGSSSLCVFSSQGTAFSLQAAGSGPAGTFALMHGDNSINYAVSLADANGAVPVQQGQPVVRSGAKGVDSPCKEGEFHADLSVMVSEQTTMAAAAGIYTGTLTLVVVPN